MAWSTPIAPVSGTVITVAWAVSNIVTPVNWLRTMTGGADPPGSNYLVKSTSTTATTWSKITEDLITAGAVTGNAGGSAIGSGTVHANRLVANSFDATQVAAAFNTNAIDATNAADIILDGAINGDAKLADGSVTGNAGGSAIGAGAIHPNRLVPDAFDSTQVQAAFGTDAFDAATVASLFGTDSFTVANVADIVQDGSILYPHAAATFFLAAVQVDQSVDYTLTGSFADITGMTHTTTRTGTYIISAHAYTTQFGILSDSLQFRMRVQRTGSGTVNSREALFSRIANTAGSVARASWVVSAVSGDVFHLQAIDVAAGGSVIEADYTWMTVQWVAA